MNGRFTAKSLIESSRTMALVSWAKGVNPSFVPEAHVGMMVTPSVRLVRPLGEGGMGAVWVADHIALHTQVVVKFIANDLKDSQDAVERFTREAAAAAQVKSPHVVQTFDHGLTADGTPYIVMELLEGRDLGAFLDDTKRCSPALVVEILTQLARALDRAHERGIIHRDIKPGNIFLCESGGGEVFVKLLDFGIAKGVELPQLDSATKTGSMIGSPFYMSPEQILGSKDVDRRSDLWSVGVVAFEALTGRKPFDAETMGGLAIRIHSEPLPQPSLLLPELSPAIDAWFRRACARPVDDRFTTAKELAEAFARAVAGEMPPSVGSGRITIDPSAVSLPASVRGAVPIGTTTEAGIVRSTFPTKTRHRLLAVIGFGAALCLGAFLIASSLRKDKVQAVAEREAAAPPAASAPQERVNAPVVVAASAPAPSNAPSAAASTERPAKTGRGAGSKASPPPRPPLPSATAAPPPPANTGHDIF